MTIRCPQCGNEYDAGLLFCGKCGAPNQQAQRIQQIEQILAGGAGTPTPATPPPAPGISPSGQAVFSGAPVGPVGPTTPAASASSVGPAGPIGPVGPTGPVASAGPIGPVGMAGSAGPSGPVPPSAPPMPPAGAPTFYMQEATKPAPARRVGRRFFGKISMQLVKWGAFAVAAVLLLTVAITGIRYALLGYHASPERLFSGLVKAVEEEDEDLLLSLVSPELTEGSFDESSILARYSEGDLRLLDIMMGQKGNMAVLYIYTGEYGTVSAIAYSILAVKEDGKWYFQFLY